MDKNTNTGGEILINLASMEVRDRWNNRMSSIVPGMTTPLSLSILSHFENLEKNNNINLNNSNVAQHKNLATSWRLFLHFSIQTYIH